MPYLLLTSHYSLNLLRRIPNRACVRAVLNRHLCALRHLNPEELCVVCGPTRFRDLDYPYVVKGALHGIEVGVDPVRGQQWIADGIGVSRLFDIVTDTSSAARNLWSTFATRDF